MKVEILGCSGGMGLGQQTTCYRVNDTLLLDAGSGLGNLSQKELLKIDTIFLTHSHLDHICFLPLLIDNLYEFIEKPIQVYALPEVIETLQQHIFNWAVWPDFSTLPTPENPVVQFNPVHTWEAITLNQLTLTPFPVEHTVPTCGYQIQSAQGQCLAFTGDTTLSSAVIDSLNLLDPLDVLITECAFPDRLLDLSRVSKHLTPQLISQLLQELDTPPKQLWLSHLKPSQQAEIRQELSQLQLGSTQLTLLEPCTQFEL